MHDDVQPNHVVDSHADYTSDSNMTPYDQYVKDNAVPVVQNNASMVPNDAYVMIDNDVHESDVLSVSHTPRNTVANNLLNAELATYKEQVELYERRARFELTEREQKIDEQLRIVICDRNIKEENLKKELHSVKLQLASTIQHNKLMSFIPFFKTLQGTFWGIQKALTKEVKEMSDAFDELEAELDQSVVDRKHDEIERKNLLIEHDNIMMMNKPSSSVNDTPDFNSVFVIGQMKASLQEKDNVIQKLKMQISQLKETRSELDRTLDFRARDFQISQLTEKVNGLQEQNEIFRAENAKIKQQYKELYDSIKITRAKHTEQITALKNENESLKV
ncbi:hypothetical protein Tco_0335506 [Tanacetum coccineum]